MRKVGIVTDSTACIPDELVEQYDICIVPLMIIFEGKSYRDGIDISPGEVYRIMRRRENLPTTSTTSLPTSCGTMTVSSLLMIRVSAR